MLVLQRQLIIMATAGRSKCDLEQLAHATTSLGYSTATMPSSNGSHTTTGVQTTLYSHCNSHLAENSVATESTTSSILTSEQFLPSNKDNKYITVSSGNGVICGNIPSASYIVSHLPSSKHLNMNVMPSSSSAKHDNYVSSAAGMHQEVYLSEPPPPQGTPASAASAATPLHQYCLAETMMDQNQKQTIIQPIHCQTQRITTTLSDQKITGTGFSYQPAKPIFIRQQVPFFKQEENTLISNNDMITTSNYPGHFSTVVMCESACNNLPTLAQTQHFSRVPYISNNIHNSITVKMDVPMKTNYVTASDINTQTSCQPLNESITLSSATPSVNFANITNTYGNFEARNNTGDQKLAIPKMYVSSCDPSINYQLESQVILPEEKIDNIPSILYRQNMNVVNTSQGPVAFYLTSSGSQHHYQPIVSHQKIGESNSQSAQTTVPCSTSTVPCSISTVPCSISTVPCSISTTLSASDQRNIFSNPDTIAIAKEVDSGSLVKSSGPLVTCDASAQTMSGAGEQYVMYVTDRSTNTLTQDAANLTGTNNRKMKSKEIVSNSNACSDLFGTTSADECVQDSGSVIIDSKKWYVCVTCNEKFRHVYQYKRHQVTHTNEKRGSLTILEKINIINRATAGERQIDLAVEYNIGRSTLTAIVKNSKKLLDLEKDGKFKGTTKRLRGAKNEVVEAALYMWYQQAKAMNRTVTGPKICKRAIDFATKLGYQDFKATHGWLDRFKHRKSISLSRSRYVKDASYNLQDDSDLPQRDFASQVLPDLLVEYDPNDVYYADEFGLLFSVLPDECAKYMNQRCAGGSRSADRLTLLACCNMTSTEKFPLLVIGRYKKPPPSPDINNLPVQYFFNGKAWITADIFDSWIKDIDSWFQRQGRKVLLIIPSSPVHQNSSTLSAIKIVTTPRSFEGPIKQGISKALKQLYRRAVLNLVIKDVHPQSITTPKKKKKTFQVSLIQCLHLLSDAWHDMTMLTITNCFTKAGISKYGPWSVSSIPDTGLATDNLELLYCLRETGITAQDNATFNDYVTMDDYVQVCHLMDDDDIIAAVTKNDSSEVDSESELDDIPLPLSVRCKATLNANGEDRDKHKNNRASSPSNNIDAKDLLPKTLQKSLETLRAHAMSKAIICPQLAAKLDRLEDLLVAAFKSASEANRAAVVTAIVTLSPTK